MRAPDFGFGKETTNNTCNINICVYGRTTIVVNGQWTGDAMSSLSVKGLELTFGSISDHPVIKIVSRARRAAEDGASSHPPRHPRKRQRVRNSKTRA